MKALKESSTSRHGKLRVTGDMLKKKGEWTEVRRRKPLPRKPNFKGTSEVTPFYLLNLSGSVRRLEIWKPYAKIGRLVDVYVANIRDAYWVSKASNTLSKVAEAIIRLHVGRCTLESRFTSFSKLL